MLDRSLQSSTTLSLVSTWMGDRQGKPSAVNLCLFVDVDLNLHVTDRLYSRHRADAYTRYYAVFSKFEIFKIEKNKKRFKFILFNHITFACFEM